MNTRSKLARGSVVVASRLSLRLGLGSGSTIGGRIGLALDPTLLERLAEGRSVALVSGTNGKTTTTRLLAEALGGRGAVATSGAGANMPAGLVTALTAAPPGQPAALEVDEGYLADVVQLVRPRVVVALNLSRDQLDRVSEVRMIAARWRSAFSLLDATVVANCDDPLVTWAASSARDVVWVAAGGLWRSDAYHCPSCDARIDFAEKSGVPVWSCQCGLVRPEPSAHLDGATLVVGDESFPVELGIPGRFNLANAAMATMGAAQLGVGVGSALAAMSRVEEVAGRYATQRLGDSSVRLLLAKNPAGWTELIELLGESERPLVVGINARDADGHDPSWLWDVPFERLGRRTVIATGDRRRDLAVRLRHAGLDHVVVDDQLAAVRRGLDSAGAGGAVDYVGNYTAFQDLRRAIGDARGTGDGPRTEAGADSSDGAATLLLAPGPPVAPVTGVLDPPIAGRPVRRRGGSPVEALTVVVVHPDLLGTYSDAGNAIVLANRAAWRGIPVELVLATSDRPIPRTGDLYCLGGGEDGPQSRSAARLADGALEAAVDGGAYVLAVCAGFQILGSTFPGSGGLAQPGLGLLDVTTARGEHCRSVGEVVVEIDDVPAALVSAASAAASGSAIEAGYRLSGFENHAGATRLGPSVTRLGRVLAGTGNGSPDDGAVEGAIGGTIIGTYLHGPVLARNPALADLLLAAATGGDLLDLDDREEEVLRLERLRAAPGRPERLRPAIRASGRVR